MAKYYTLRELSAELDIPKSTIVKYKDFFGDYMPLFGAGKRKKFDDMGVEVVRAVRRMREEENLDWLEIKDKLEEEYGKREPAPVEEEEKGVVRSRESVAAADAKIEYLAHMVNALAGELVRMTAGMNQIDDRARRLENAVEAISSHTKFLRGNIELVIAELMKRDAGGKKQIEQIMEMMAKQLEGFNAAIKKAAAAAGADGRPAPARKVEIVEKAPQPAKSPETQEKTARLEKENEILKKKLREMILEQRKSADKPPAAPAPAERKLPAIHEMDRDDIPDTDSHRPRGHRSGGRDEKTSPKKRGFLSWFGK